MNKQKFWIGASLSLLVAAQAALAHITLESPKAIAGEGYKAVLRVGHGCTGGAATTALSVLIPEGVTNAKPMPKAGWAIVVKKMKLAEPLNVYGRTITETVQEITWTATSKEAAIGDDQYDEFIVRGTLPAKAGVLWWKTVQSCANSKNEWTEVPAQGTSIKGLKGPAAPLEVVPATPIPAAVSAPVHQH
jgi:periplasmic copper chaperone A